MAKAKFDIKIISTPATKTLHAAFVVATDAAVLKKLREDMGKTYIVGKVTAVGGAVSKFKVGDLAGVGVTVQTCMECENCKAGAEPYCLKGMVGTYNAKDYDGEMTYGGYANNIVAPEHYVYSISPKLELAAEYEVWDGVL